MREILVTCECQAVWEGLHAVLNFPAPSHSSPHISFVSIPTLHRLSVRLHALIFTSAFRCAGDSLLSLCHPSCSWNVVFQKLERNSSCSMFDPRVNCVEGIWRSKVTVTVRLFSNIIRFFFSLSSPCLFLVLRILLRHCFPSLLTFPLSCARYPALRHQDSHRWKPRADL